MKTAVTQKGFSFVGEFLQAEKKCVALNKAELATLERAAKILEALERRVDPHEQADFPSHSETSIGDIATAATYLSVVLREGRHHSIATIKEEETP